MNDVPFTDDLLNIRNIFRVAFLSCSHIRLEMCSGACRASPRFCFAAALLSCATTSIIYHSFSLLSTTFLNFFKKVVYATERLRFREQKNETNHLEITSVHFIFLSGERGI